MTYLVTSTKPALGNTPNQSGLSIFDEEATARSEAEKLLKNGCKDVTVWQQLAQPIIEQKVIWNDTKQT